jgi:hypothetical protein
MLGQDLADRSPFASGEQRTTSCALGSRGVFFACPTAAATSALPDALEEAMSDDDAQATELPEHLSPADVGKACNMSRRAAKNLLRAVGILELRDDGRWYVRAEALRERLPDVYARVRVWSETAGDEHEES